ncbi:AbrB family transcriptional regulator [Rhizobium sp. CG5]|nr:AbrB family transcriptional regulator [Rhizobium sp. CG5]
MFGAALLSFYDRSRVLPPIFRDGARPVIGVMAGSAFTPVVAQTITSWWVLVPILVIFFLLVTTCGFYFFRRLGYDRSTAIFASMPGGLGEMTLLGGQFGADVRKLVLVHSVRIIIVVSVVPILLMLMTDVNLARGAAPVADRTSASAADWLILLACAGLGYVAGRPLRSFGGIMIMPLLFSACAHGVAITAVAPPAWLVAGMQVIIGCITGARFAGIKFHEARLALIQGVFWTSILIGLALAAAEATSILVHQSFAALFLAFAPGGFAEMSIIAFAANIEVAFVVTCHVFRTIYVVLAGPSIHRLLAGNRN